MEYHAYRSCSCPFPSFVGGGGKFCGRTTTMCAAYRKSLPCSARHPPLSQEQKEMLLVETWYLRLGLPVNI